MKDTFVVRSELGIPHEYDVEDGFDYSLPLFWRKSTTLCYQIVHKVDCLILAVRANLSRPNLRRPWRPVLVR